MCCAVNVATTTMGDIRVGIDALGRTGDGAGDFFALALTFTLLATHSDGAVTDVVAEAAVVVIVLDIPARVITTELVAFTDNL